MQIRLTANVGVFAVEALVTGTDEAQQFVSFIYRLGDKEERVAIQHESAAPEVDPRQMPINFDVEPQDKPAPTVTVEDAVKAVKEFAAVHKPDAARALMAKVGISRTSEITAEIAPKIVELVKAAS